MEIYCYFLNFDSIIGGDKHLNFNILREIRFFQQSRNFLNDELLEKGENCLKFTCI